MVRDMTSGSPIKRILAFCLPLFIGNLFQQFYGMVDSMIVGKYLGVQAFAAVGSTGSINFLIIGFALGLCMGMTIPVSQDFGAGNIQSLRRCVAHAVYLAIAASAIIGVVMTIYTRPVLQLLNTPPDIIDGATSYISIIFGGVGTIILYNLLSGLMRALGDSRTPLYYLIVACIVNVVLDIVFIRYMGMGVEGAAWATVIAQLISGLLCLYSIWKHFPMLHFTRKDAKFSWKIVGRLSGISLPMGLQFSITAIGSIMMQAAVNGLGSSMVAAMSAGSRVQAAVCTPLEAAGITMATYASQNYGAKRFDRVRKGTFQIMCLCAVYCVVALGIANLWGIEIAKLFIRAEETEILALAEQYFCINAYFFVALGVVLVYRNTLQGLGYTKAAMCAGLLEMIARATVSLILVPAFGFDGACFSNPAAWLAADLFLLPMYYWGLQKLQRAQQQQTLCQSAPT